MSVDLGGRRIIKKKKRRSEELHILNEIGRALSSTLDPDALFERIYSEMQRLLDVNSLFIAFFFQAEDGIRYRTVTGVQTCALPISQTRIGHVHLKVADLDRALRFYRDVL